MFINYTDFKGVGSAPRPRRVRCVMMLMYSNNLKDPKDFMKSIRINSNPQDSQSIVEFPVHENIMD